MMVRNMLTRCARAHVHSPRPGSAGMPQGLHTHVYIVYILIYQLFLLLITSNNYRPITTRHFGRACYHYEIKWWNYPLTELPA